VKLIKTSSFILLCLSQQVASAQDPLSHGNFSLTPSAEEAEMLEQSRALVAQSRQIELDLLREELSTLKAQNRDRQRRPKEGMCGSKGSIADRMIDCGTTITLGDAKRWTLISRHYDGVALWLDESTKQIWGTMVSSTKSPGYARCGLDEKDSFVDKALLSDLSHMNAGLPDTGDIKEAMENGLGTLVPKLKQQPIWTKLTAGNKLRYAYDSQNNIFFGVLNLAHRLTLVLSRTIVDPKKNHFPQNPKKLFSLQNKS